MPHAVNPIVAMNRANQVLHEQLCERGTLSCGLAFYTTHYAALGINQVRELMLPAGTSMDAAFAEIDQFFADRGLACQRVVLCVDQPVQPAHDWLLQHGYKPRHKTVMVLRDYLDVPMASDVRVLPGRALRAVVRELALENPYFAPEQRETAADALLARLDDPSFELLVAMRNGEPAGMAAVLDVGGIAGVFNVRTVEAHQEHGVATTMMSHLLRLTRRLAIGTTVLEVEEGGEAARQLYERCGFAVADTYHEYRRDAITGDVT